MSDDLRDVLLDRLEAKRRDRTVRALRVLGGAAAGTLAAIMRNDDATPQRRREAARTVLEHADDPDVAPLVDEAQALLED